MSLFADVAVHPKQWLGAAKEQLYTAQILLPYIEERQTVVDEMMRNTDVQDILDKAKYNPR